MLVRLRASGIYHITPSHADGGTGITWHRVLYSISVFELYCFARSRWDRQTPVLSSTLQVTVYAFDNISCTVFVEGVCQALGWCDTSQTYLLFWEVSLWWYRLETFDTFLLCERISRICFAVYVWLISAVQFWVVEYVVFEQISDTPRTALLSNLSHGTHSRLMPAKSPNTAFA